MKIGIIGDIHGNLEALEAVLAQARLDGVEGYVCLGDVVGYNANPRECLQRVRELKCLAVVQGNHDFYSANQNPMYGFNPTASLSVDWTREQLTPEEKCWLANLPLTEEVIFPGGGAFTVTHGTLDFPASWGYVLTLADAAECLRLQKYQLCFVGHTHAAEVYRQEFSSVSLDSEEPVFLEEGCKYLINPGSVGQPRDRDPRAAYNIYDTDHRLVISRRVPYDVEAAQRKILDAGLPPRCAERLALGI